MYLDEQITTSATVQNLNYSAETNRFDEEIILKKKMKNPFLLING